MLLNANWYDVVVAVALGYGVWSGIRRGVTGEMLSIVAWVLTVALALFGYEPLGRWLQGKTDWDIELAKLLAFMSIVVAMYLISGALRALFRRRLKQRPLSAMVESVGGAVIGLTRMGIVMAAVTVAVCLTRSEFWREQVGRRSRFGSIVVCLVPDVAEAVSKKVSQEIWFMRELKRPAEPGIESVTTNGPSR